jgi:hypothetical protein
MNPARGKRDGCLCGAVRFLLDAPCLFILTKASVPVAGLNGLVDSSSKWGKRHSKRPQSITPCSTFDLLTVNETAQEPPSDDADNKLNTPAALAIEATWINQMFKEQVCSLIILS